MASGRIEMDLVPQGEFYYALADVKLYNLLGVLREIFGLSVSDETCFMDT